MIRNNQTFVYKIIHDMRHPTIALTEGLELLLKQEKQSLGYRSNVSTFQILGRQDMV